MSSQPPDNTAWDYPLLAMYLWLTFHNEMLQYSIVYMICEIHLIKNCRGYKLISSNDSNNNVNFL